MGFIKHINEDDLKELNAIEDTVGGVRIVVEREDSGIDMCPSMGRFEE
jgi:hypothetical protein